MSKHILVSRGVLSPLRVSEPVFPTRLGVKPLVVYSLPLVAVFHTAASSAVCEI